MYVCMYVCICVCMYTHTNTHSLTHSQVPTYLPAYLSTHTHCDTHTLAHTLTFTCDFVFGGQRVKGKAARIWSSPLSLRSDQTGHRGLGEEREERESARACARPGERRKRESAPCFPYSPHGKRAVTGRPKMAGCVGTISFVLLLAHSRMLRWTRRSVSKDFRLRARLCASTHACSRALSDSSERVLSCPKNSMRWSCSPGTLPQRRPGSAVRFKNEFRAWSSAESAPCDCDP